MLASGVAHEIRTTVHPALLADAEVMDLARDLSTRGVKRYVIQAFRSQGCENTALVQDAQRASPLASLVKEVTSRFRPEP